MTTVFVFEGNDRVRRVPGNTVRGEASVLFVREACDGDAALEALPTNVPDEACLAIAGKVAWMSQAPVQAPPA